MARVLESQSIIDEHGALVNWALRWMHIPPNAVEDARQGGAVGLLTAAKRYQPERGAYRSFAASHVLHEVRQAVGWDRRRRPENMALDHLAVADHLHRSEGGYERVERQEALLATARFTAQLPPEDRHILQRLYEDGASQTEVARELGITKMSMSRRVSRLHALGRQVLARYVAA